MRAFLRYLLLGATLLSVQVPAQADAVGDAIRKGGVALLMRHATAPGVGDPEGFKLDECGTQRNLSDEGRAEARRIGAYLKKLGLQPGEVLSSQWCRCRETASLAFGSYQDWPMLNSFFSDRSTEPKQTEAVVNRISQIRAGQKPLVLVTHQVIVTSVTGVFPQSGEVVVVAPRRVDGKAGVRLIGTIKPEATTR